MSSSFNAPAEQRFRPSAYPYGPATIGMLFALLVTTIRFGDRTLSPVGLLGLGVGLTIGAYFALFAFRVWVFLYDDRLEIHPALAKLLHDRLSLPLYRPKTVRYRDIVGLRRTRGFGGLNALVIVRRAPRWQRSEYGIPRLGVADYADLEAELLRRVPPDCELYSVNVLGRRGPFR